MSPAVEGLPVIIQVMIKVSAVPVALQVKAFNKERALVTFILDTRLE
jgi:energy-converting hydrogenase Eha subunit E